MRFFDKKLSLLLVFISLPLFFLPKINLINIANETAGLRIDDFILLLFCIVLFTAHYVLRKSLQNIEIWIFILTGYSLLSYFLNRIFVSLELIHVDAKIFYSLRLFEYFLFFYIGTLSCLFFRLSNVVTAFLIWNLFIMTFQKSGILGDISVSGYHADSTYRVYGIASFPSEMGALLNLIFCYLIYEHDEPSKLRKLFSPLTYKFIKRTYIYWLFLLFSIFIVFTGSRIAVATLIFCFLFKLKDKYKLRYILSLLPIISFVFFGSLVVTLVIIFTPSIFQRSMLLISWNNISLISEVWKNITITHNPLEGFSVENGAYDMSWWIRIQKWCYALKIYYLNPQCYLQGIGPGFAMPALDGGFVRILTEYGIIGSFIFWKLFSIMYKKTIQLKWMLIAFLLNMIFFDIYLAYKPMSLLFLVSGYAYSYSTTSEETLQSNPVSNHTVKCMM